MNDWIDFILFDFIGDMLVCMAYVVKKFCITSITQMN